MHPVLLSRPAGAPPGASVHLNFATDQGFQSGNGGGPVARFLTTSASSVRYGEWRSGLWQAFASNVPVITDKGLAVWMARTNVALYCRDLTNAAWTKTNCTAALNQVGIDGAANSASSLTATAGNATCLQAITLASSARFQSAFVRRLTGSGTVEMTMDNGSTWTAITVTSSWTRVSIPTQTLANPIVGFRIATSGDAIAVDFVQNENGTFATSPILTTSGSAARAADVVTLRTALTFGLAYSIAATATPMAAVGFVTQQIILSIHDGTTNNRAQIHRAATTSLASVALVSAGATQYSVGGAVAGVGISYSGAMAALAGSHQAGLAGVVSAAIDRPMIVAPTIVSFGSVANIFHWNGTIERATFFPRRISAEELRRVTAP